MLCPLSSLQVATYSPSFKPVIWSASNHSLQPLIDVGVNVTVLSLVLLVLKAAVLELLELLLGLSL